MSKWTHVIGAIHYDLMGEAFNVSEKGLLKARIEEILATAPPIRGSEGNAHVFVNVNPDVTLCSSPDSEYCKECQRFDTETEKCQALLIEQLDCEKVNFCSRVIITLQGDLRDQELEDTVKQTKEFLQFVQNIEGGYIRDQGISIFDGYRTEVITL